VVEPVPRAARADEFIVVGYFQPDNLLQPYLAPLGQTFAGKFHCAAGDPQKDEPGVGEFLDL